MVGRLENRPWKVGTTDACMSTVDNSAFWWGGLLWYQDMEGKAKSSSINFQLSISALSQDDLNIKLSGKHPNLQAFRYFLLIPFKMLSLQKRIQNVLDMKAELFIWGSFHISQNLAVTIYMQLVCNYLLSSVRLLLIDGQLLTGLKFYIFLFLNFLRAY